MAVKVRPLVGYKSLTAFRAFHVLMLGVKMLPEYMGEAYEDFYARVESMPEKDQETIIRQAAHFVELGKDEVEAIVGFCEDPNGVAYTEANMKNLGPKDLVEMIVAVCVSISKIKVNLVSESEKKK